METEPGNVGGGQPVQTQAPVQAQEAVQAQAKEALTAAVKSGVNWFFWIAGLSMVNSVVYLAGGSISFVVGLGMTRLVDELMKAVAEQVGGGGGLVARVIGFGLDLVIAGIFVGIGFLGRKHHRWAVVLGMTIYVLDAVLFVLVAEWLSVAFHAFALWCLWRGLRALGRLNALEKMGPPPAGPAQPSADGGLRNT